MNMNPVDIVKDDQAVCAWGRHVIERGTGRHVCYLSDSEYARTVSHTCCPACWERAKERDIVENLVTQEVA